MFSMGSFSLVAEVGFGLSVDAEYDYYEQYTMYTALSDRSYLTFCVSTNVWTLRNKAAPYKVSCYTWVANGFVLLGTICEKLVGE